MITNDKKYPKRILIVGYRILNWLYILIIPILRNRFSTKFLVIAPLGVKNDFMKVLNKEDEFITYDDQLEDMCSHGFNKDLGKEEKIAREIEKKYSINYMRDIIQQDRSLSASFLSYSPKYIWNKSRLSNNQNLIKLVNGYVKYTEEIEINANIETVVALFDNPYNMQKYMDGIESYTVLNGNLREVGTRAEIVVSYIEKDVVKRRIVMIEEIMASLE